MSLIKTIPSSFSNKFVSFVFVFLFILNIFGDATAYGGYGGFGSSGSYNRGYNEAFGFNRAMSTGNEAALAAADPSSPYRFGWGPGGVVTFKYV